MEKAIIINNLTKKFGDFTAVNDISFEVNKGEIFGFLGANGAGKTTAMRILCGLSLPTAGSGTVAGYDIWKEQDHIKKHIGYMSQRFSLYSDLTLRENIRLFAGIYGLKPNEIRTESAQLLEKVGMTDIADKLARELPLGWRQKLAFSIALIHKPDIVFLDEPTGGVDPETRRRFWEMIYDTAETGTTVFVTTHYMDEAEYCDRVSIMVDGRIDAMGSPDTLKKQFNARNMDEVFRKLATTAKRSE